MENKYYTPSIEDIRVGYECEELFEQGWKSWRIHPKAYISDYYVKKIEVGKIRTPYLTKEQIEAEGWKRHPSPSCLFMMKDFGFGEVEIRLTILDNNSILISSNGSVIYDGKCPSINEFRTIIKLLGI